MEPSPQPQREAVIEEKTFYRFEPVQRQESQFRRAITVKRPPHDVFTQLFSIDTLKRIFKEIDHIEPINDEDSTWTATLENGEPSIWQMNLKVKVPGQSVSWTATTNDNRKAWGEVQLARAPGDLGTIVALTMDYSLPGGFIDEWMAAEGRRDPDSLARTSLHRFKAFLETCEIPTTDGQPTGRTEGLLQTQH